MAERDSTATTAAADREPQAAARGPAAALVEEGNEHERQGRMAQARSAYERALACDPQCAEAHFNLGNLSHRVGELLPALRSYQAAVGTRPQFADAFVGMANVFVSLGRPHEAAASLRWAVGVQPDHAAAHRLLGTVLSGLGDLDAAETSLRRAGSLEPESTEIPLELAQVLQYRSRYEEAAQLLARALERAPTWAARAAFGNCATRAQFTVDDAPVRAALTTAIDEAWAMPHALCAPALSLLRLDERIAGCVRRANESWPARPTRAALFGPHGLAALAADRLLHALLEATPVTSVHFERFLACARHALLELASSEQPPDAADADALSFYAAVTRQCFINEFVFDCPAEELGAAADCRTRLQALLNAGRPVPPHLLLAAAAYAPLYGLQGADRLLVAAQPGPVAEVLREQIREPLQEQALREGVARLTPVADRVSEAVREQYEENPYPRWIRMPLREQPLPFNGELRRVLPFARFVPLPDDAAPEVLVAGCGTGRDAIFVARQWRGARVLAIDLSLASIGYARRKTQELGLPNLEYAQADILELGDYARSFDIIGAVGVLHHLADPFRGWRILLSRLRPGGFMCLGLYSRIARQPVVRAREFIRARGYAGTPDDIRRFRRDVIAGDAGAEARALARSPAFYSLSECRDLAFNVQEQQLTLPRIESFLGEAGVRFLGFELDPRVVSQYRARFPGDPACDNLRNWALFEAESPDTFTAMYKFWIQR